MYDLIIIGGGPAAFSAMAYAAGKQLEALMVYEQLGGKTSLQGAESGEAELPAAQLSTELLEHLHDLHVADQRERQLPMHEAVRLLARQVVGQRERLLHAAVREVSVEGDDFVVALDGQAPLRSRAVIVATGARPILLDVPGARRVARYGLGYSIATYAHLSAGKRVAVVGIGERALRGTAELARLARRVYLITPDGPLPPSPLSAALCAHPAVEIMAGYEVCEITGEDGLDALILRRDALVKRLPIERAYVDLGLVPRSDLVRQIAVRDPEGFIVVDERGATSQPGLFAAGDVTTQWGEQILVAIGDGARAAIAAYEYLLVRELVGMS